MSDQQDSLSAAPAPTAETLEAIAAAITIAQIDDAIQASLARGQQYMKWPDDFPLWSIEPYRTDMRASIAAALARRQLESAE